MQRWIEATSDSISKICINLLTIIYIYINKILLTVTRFMCITIPVD